MNPVGREANEQVGDGTFGGPKGEQSKDVADISQLSRHVSQHASSRNDSRYHPTFSISMTPMSEISSNVFPNPNEISPNTSPDCITKSPYLDHQLSSWDNEPRSKRVGKGGTHHRDQGGNIISGKLVSELCPNKQPEKNGNEGKDQGQDGAYYHNTGLIRRCDHGQWRGLTGEEC